MYVYTRNTCAALSVSSTQTPAAPQARQQHLRASLTMYENMLAKECQMLAKSGKDLSCLNRA